jgi:hypothetical protein
VKLSDSQLGFLTDYKFVNLFGIYEGLCVGRMVGLVLGNVLRGLLGRIVCNFVGENVGDEIVELLVGCAVGDEIVVNEMIDNIDGVRVRISVGDVVGFSLGLFERLVACEFVGTCEVLFLREFFGMFVRVVDRK